VPATSTIPARNLRIVSLNLWGGRILDPLLAFIREQAPRTDVFCFQEALNADQSTPIRCGFETALFSRLAGALPDFQGRFDRLVCWPETTDEGRPFTVPFGVATFVRRALRIEKQSARPIIRHFDNLDAVEGLHEIVRPLQLTRLTGRGGSILIANYHGLARPGSKLDSDERLAQSAEIRRVLAARLVNQGGVVLIGDFNLLPETESIRMLEREYRNLIGEHAISTTRSRLNPYYGKPGEQRFADYAFVSSGMQVASFEVPDVEVSDHLPLILEVGW